MSKWTHPYFNQGDDKGFMEKQMTALAEEPTVAGRRGVPINAPVGGIRVVQDETQVARPARTKSTEFEELAASMHKDGQINSILITPVYDNDGLAIDGQFTLIDGQQRLAVAQSLGWDYINATVFERVDDDDILGLQITGNLVRVKGKAAEEGQWYLKWLNQGLARGEVRTVAMAAKMTQKSEQYINGRLSITKLSEETQALVNSGVIPTTNAVHLAKMAKIKPPHPDLARFTKLAETDTTEDFALAITEAIKTERKLRADGSSGDGTEFRKPKFIGITVGFELWQMYNEKISAKEADTRDSFKEAQKLGWEGTDEDFDEAFAEDEEVQADLAEQVEACVPATTRAYFKGIAQMLQIDDATWAKREASRTAAATAKAEKKAAADKVKAEKAAAKKKAAEVTE